MTIKGSHLGGVFSVDFGGTSSTQVTPISGSEVQVVAPAAAFPERVDVIATTASGGSAPNLADRFTYGSPPPPVTTSVTLTPSEGAAARGQTVTLKATVAPTDGGGSVAFYADGSSTALSNCDAQALTPSGGAYQASCSTSSLALGSHALSATYSGDASYAGSSGATNVSITRNAEEEAKIKTEEVAAAAAKKHQEEEAAAKAKAEGEAKAAAEARAKVEAEAAAKKKSEEEQVKKSSTKPLTRAQLLAKALKTCKKESKKKRAECEAAAKKKYGPRKRTSKKKK